MNTQLISFIVPVYNAQAYLEQCLQSILEQTYSHWEAILINGGSTDQSASICDSYAARDHRFRVIHKENGGVSDARNTGLEYAKGAYITFLDADDAVREDFLENCLQTATQYEVDIVIGHFFIWDERNHTFYYFVDQEQKDQTEFLTIQEALDRQIIWKNLNTAPFVIPCGKLFKASLFDTVRFPKNKRYEDEYTLHKTFLKAKKIALINKEFYMYRRHGQSFMTSDFNPEKIINNIEALEERMVDLVLAKRETQLVRQKLYHLLQEAKHEFESHHCTQHLEYLRILNKLDLFSE
ncbi:TPA: glycosyltransferase family 2 protein [Streptococcus suis]|nr:glycosyltransferase family 2 protein [Streptococcus suis]